LRRLEGEEAERMRAFLIERDAQRLRKVGTA